MPFLSHTDLTELTDIISFDVNIFCGFRAFRVPFLSHTDLTELTDIISLDTTLSVLSVVSVCPYHSTDFMDFKDCMAKAISPYSPISP